MIKNCINNWQQNKEFELWMNPPYGAWSKVKKDDIILIHYDGENIIQTCVKTKPIKDRWNDLVLEADNNFIEEDNAANKIIATIKGYNIRKSSKYILNEIFNKKRS